MDVDSALAQPAANAQDGRRLVAHRQFFQADSRLVFILISRRNDRDVAQLP